jgi:hypothetical protein
MIFTNHHHLAKKMHLDTLNACIYKISCVYDIAVIDNDFYKSSSSGKKNAFGYVKCLYL